LVSTAGRRRTVRAPTRPAAAAPNSRIIGGAGTLWPPELVLVLPELVLPDDPEEELVEELVDEEVELDVDELVELPPDEVDVETLPVEVVDEIVTLPLELPELPVNQPLLPKKPELPPHQPPEVLGTPPPELVSTGTSL